MIIVITCEHGGNDIPGQYLSLFKGMSERLQSHEGWDIGALELAKFFASELADYFYFQQVSRLLIDLNRSKRHPRLFSDFTKYLDPTQKNKILVEYYFPFRNEVFSVIENAIRQNQRVLHVSVHSFTPYFKGHQRSTDIGLLYDPKRGEEKNFCHVWKDKIHTLSRDIRVRYNYPYKGIADGFITFLRKNFDNAVYVGLELEVNQKIVMDGIAFEKLKKILVSSLGPVCNSLGHRRNP
jgi:predicted N-formylglutamate amidohydrolase